MSQLLQSHYFGKYSHSEIKIENVMSSAVANQTWDYETLVLFSYSSIMARRVGLRRAQRPPVRRGDVRLPPHTRPLIPPPCSG